MAKASKSHGKMETPKTRANGTPKQPTPNTRGDAKKMVTPKAGKKG